MRIETELGHVDIDVDEEVVLSDYVYELLAQLLLDTSSPSNQLQNDVSNVPAASTEAHSSHSSSHRR
ncbi:MULTISPECIES: hypothetical protein [Alicyclobacillus]|uniref:Uncharacterized protein n=1 Tax=Alicyclobacillus acidoterrestris (strain ATCC 49025 / DSM 3922 / CIP 106132 / NCIMB 13137 / GD3B) TaxID=1356854 RepID=A0A9E6ZPT2_ALIAG|nr:MULTISPECIES: hypothetical protein [Alicyclobacillus]UNO50981.1 hypothetical protein K1I37_04735 [Alicyclobacillus acidoterrestris]